MGNVLFTSEELTVHVTDAPKQKDQFGNEYWDVHSEILLPGQYLPEERLPDYVKEAVKAGKVPGASFVSEDKAKEIAARADELRGLVAGATPAAYQVADGWDNSHSDHLVEDAVRSANLADRAEADAGGGSEHDSGVAPPAAEEASKEAAKDAKAESKDTAKS